MFDNITTATETPVTLVTDVEVAWTLAQAEHAERQAQSQRQAWTRADELRFQSQRASQANAIAAMRRRETELTEANRYLSNLVNELRQPIEVGDERILHLWIKAAQTANEQNHCSEYDRIARSLGIPTRDELREQGHLTQTYDVEVQVNLVTTITVTVEASDEREAIEVADSYDRYSIWSSLDRDDLSEDSIEAWDAQNAEEV